MSLSPKQSKVNHWKKIPQLILKLFGLSIVLYDWALTFTNSDFAPKMGEMHEKLRRLF
jgi:hypothetical protein